MERKIEITSDEILAGGGIRYVKGETVTGSEVGLRCLVDSQMAKWVDEPTLPPAAPSPPPPPTPESEEPAEVATTSRKRSAASAE